MVSEAREIPFIPSDFWPTPPRPPPTSHFTTTRSDHAKIPTTKTAHTTSNDRHLGLQRLLGGHIRVELFA